MNGKAENGKSKGVASPCHNAELPAAWKDKISPETSGGFKGLLPKAKIAIACAYVDRARRVAASRAKVTRALRSIAA